MQPKISQNVSASHVEMNSGIQFYDGIDTEDIQQILLKVC